MRRAAVAPWRTDRSNAQESSTRPRQFQGGDLLWAVDHLVEGGAGRDHGVDAVFFFDLEVDEEGFAAGAGFGHGGGYVGALVT